MHAPSAPPEPPEPEGERTLIRRPGALQATAAASAPGWRAVVAVTDAQGRTQRRPLAEGAPLRVGRRAPSELQLDDTEVSGRHCELRREGETVWLQDLGSTNGTWIEGRRLQAPLALSPGQPVQLGRCQLVLERHDAQQLAEREALDRDLDRASHYLHALLPPPIDQGPLRVDWHFQPCARVGGDVFGYQWLDPQRVALYLLDVSGHGVGAALHAVTVLNALRLRTLPDTDWADPARVLQALNALVPMEQHDGMYLTAWYGVIDLAAGQIHFASAGQHPAYLVTPGDPASPPRPLQTRNLPVGAMDGVIYRGDSAPLRPGQVLHLFSDGVYEIVDQRGRTWDLEDLLPVLQEPLPPGRRGPEHLFARVRALARPGPLDDDFSWLVVHIG